MTTRRSQTGAATLVVVMVLFFIISLVAAYTSRNLIFEQRTSANQYRSTQALEAAEAGLEWAVSMLNFGRIDTSCVGSTAVTNDSFRQRYLTVDPANGKITPVLDAGAPLTPTCVRTPTGWTCACPTTGTPTLTAPTAAGIWPAFRLRFVAVQELPAAPGSPRQPGVIRAEVVGCTRVDAPTCLAFDGLGELNEGRVVVSSLIALTGNPVGLPSAALTMAGGIAAGAAPPLRVYNTQPSGLGFTLHARDAVVDTTGMDLKTSPGSPLASSVIRNDPALNLPAIGGYTAADRMFATVFNMRPETFRTQQAAVQVACGTTCSAAAVRAAAAQNPNQPIWLSGRLNVDSSGDIGSATAPVVIVSNGDLKFSTSGVTIFGLVYNRLAAGSSNWVTEGSGTVNGAVVTDGGVAGTGTATIAFDSDVLNRVRSNVGTYVRAPGSWRDFQ